MYTNSIPTAIAWDPSYEDGRSSIPQDDEHEGDQVWEDMEHAEDGRDNGGEGEDEEHTDYELSTNSSHKKSRTR